MSVINKVSEARCCGCSACFAICPKHCISMKESKEGFLHPVAEAENCNDCGLCESVCPVLAKHSPQSPPETVFAAKLRDEVRRKQSSSGGVFSLLAESILEEGGVVCAARFASPLHLAHDFCTDKADLPAFLGSKYVQSDMGDCFRGIKKYLSEGRKLLFAGTGCQIMGLKAFLGKKYEGLITMEVICHGVPSPALWRKYLRDICERQGIAAEELSSVEFRNKDYSWHRYCMKIKANNETIYRKNLYDDPYLKAFLANLTLRNSCHNCPAKGFVSQSDITVGDYWGVDKHHPQTDDDKGVSCLLVRNTSLLSFFDEIKIELTPSKYEYILTSNPAMEHSALPHPKKAQYLQDLQSTAFIKCTKAYTKTPLPQTLKRKLRPFLSKLKHLILTPIKATKQNNN